MAAANPLSISAALIDANIASGVEPRGMIMIRQAIKAAGAIQADIEVM